jgi:beta-galactosidase
VEEKGGAVRFERTQGRAEIWLDGKKVAEKGQPAEASMEVAIPPGTSDHAVTVLFQTDASEDIGISGKVLITNSKPPAKK